MEMGRISLKIPESTASMARISLLISHGKYRKKNIHNIKRRKIY